MVFIDCVYSIKLSRARTYVLILALSHPYHSVINMLSACVLAHTSPYHANTVPGMIQDTARPGFVPIKQYEWNHEESFTIMT